MLDQTISNLDIFDQLPANIKWALQQHRRISKLFNWQVDCLNMCYAADESDIKNLVYSSPTSGGKTLVAELLLIREVTFKRRSAIFVLPFVSLVNEKVASLSPFGVTFNFHVEEYAGSKGTAFPPRKRRVLNTIYIATFEKASFLINSLIEAGRADEIGLVVFDELHMVFEQSYRAITLEVLITKIKYFAEKAKIIGMSATLSNKQVVLLKRFLNAEFFNSSYRPVKLHEHLVCDSDVFTLDSKSVDWKSSVKFVSSLSQTTPTCSDAPSCENKENNKENLLKKLSAKNGWTQDLINVFKLVEEVLVNNYSCLVFCQTKKNCETTCKSLAHYLSIFCNLNMEKKKNSRNGLIRNIVEANAGICDVLNKCIMFGIAYHHSGLAEEERKFIEDAYSANVLSVICCTSTLAAGVNLPARRVIVRSIYVGIDMMSSAQYRQMIGRAGRTGIDDTGESFLFVEKSKKPLLEKLLESNDEYEFDASGKIVINNTHLYECNNLYYYATIILGLIGLSPRKMFGLKEIMDFFCMSLSLTLISRVSSEYADFEVVIKSAIDILTNKLQLIKTNPDNYFECTEKGRGAYASNINVQMLEKTNAEFNKVLTKVNLMSDLQIFYLCVSAENLTFTIGDALTLSRVYAKLDDDDKVSMALLGVDERYTELLLANILKSSEKLSAEEMIKLSNSLILNDLAKGETIYGLCSKYGIVRGYVERLKSEYISHANQLLKYTAEVPKLSRISVIIRDVMQRLTKQSHVELDELLTLPGVKIARARQLFRAGYRTLDDVAKANRHEMAEAIPNLFKNHATNLIASARMLLLERCKELQENADAILAPIRESLTQDLFNDLI